MLSDARKSEGASAMRRLLTLHTCSIKKIPIGYFPECTSSNLNFNIKRAQEECSSKSTLLF